MKKVEINEQELIKLNNEGLTPEEIGVKLEVSGSSIRRKLKELGLKGNRKIIKWDNEQVKYLKELLKQGKTANEIAGIMNIAVNTVRSRVKSLGLSLNRERAKTFSKEKLELTQEQWEVLYGSLLGDMSIDTNWKNARPIISQGGKQEKYFDYKCKIFHNLIGKPCKKDRYDKRTNKYYHKYVVKFLTNPIYTELKEKLYPNGIKTVTKEWLSKITPRGLAFWFMDDGTNSGEIATNSFSKEECLLIIDWFKEKWGIICTLHITYNNNNEQYLVYITKESRPVFYNLVIPYFIPSMTYKLENWNP